VDNALVYSNLRTPLIKAEQPLVFWR
jgi:hypothetical protein